MIHSSFIRCLLLVAALIATAPGAVFQYETVYSYTNGKGETVSDSAFLWIPAEAAAVRGVVVCGMTLIEPQISRDPIIRAACAAQQLAIIQCKTGLNSPDIPAVLTAFAAQSGYAELAVAPMFFIGHSAGGPQALDQARKYPERCIGLIQYRGGMPSAESPIAPGIPSLAMMAQFDEFWGDMRKPDGFESWERALTFIAGFRAADPRHLGSFLVEPGAGHFSWSERNARYLALFLSKAAAARIPASWDPLTAKAPELIALDPASGWLTSFDLKGDDIPCASFADYAGDKARTSWHVDRELAEATVAYQRGLTKRKDQFITWTDKVWVDAGARFFHTDPTWVGDGQTIEVHPVFADKVPSQYEGKGPKWVEAGQPVGHGSAPISVQVACGPMIATGPTTLRLMHDAIFPATAGKMQSITFFASSVGDAEYRFTEQVGMMPRGFNGLTGGKPQTITCSKPADLQVGGAPIALDGVSSEGLPVEYHLAYGPAVVRDGSLHIAELPKRAKLPVPVKLVAYQCGRGIEPKIKVAAPVVHELQVVAP